MLDYEIKYLESLYSHIDYVKEAGKMIGVKSLQLAIHDQSKFSPQEFPHYAKHFFGGGDKDNFNYAWLHHIHNNPHHWQHYLIGGMNTSILEMPKKYALEMVADWMGASMAYTESWDMSDWLNSNRKKIILHPNTARYINDVLGLLMYEDFEGF